jgi:hypothetical protein
MKDAALRTMPQRHTLISGAALAGALLWGAVELVALQWSRFNARLRMLGLFRAA